MFHPKFFKLNSIIFCILWCYSIGFSQTIPLELICSLPDEIRESSGLISFNQGLSFWTHNDSGGEAVLYEINTKCEIIRKVIIGNAQNIDWEEICLDELGNIYIGDFGNNSNDRKNLIIYKIKSLDVHSLDSVVAEKIEFEYVNQSLFPPDVSAQNFDMEAFVWENDSLHLFSKNRTNPFSGFTYHHTLPDQEGMYKTVLRDSFYTGLGLMQQQWITGASISADKSKLLLLSYDKAWIFYPLNSSNYFSSKIIPFRFTTLTQKEAVCFANENEIWLTDEYLPSLRLGGNLYRLNLDPVINSTEDGLFQNYHAFPNPSAGMLQILPKDFKKLIITDLYGKNISSIYHLDQIDLSFMSSGIYIINIFNHQGAYKLLWSKN